MSIIDRFVRALETMSNIELDGQTKGGMRGEQYAEELLVEGQNESYIHSPLLPHPRKPGVFFETDFLVYTHGTLFCVEIKNFRGKVYYPAVYRTEYVTQRWLFFFQRQVPRKVLDHEDKTMMIQEKSGPNGTETREMPNPLYKTQEYAKDLNRFLTRIDQRLQNVPIVSVLAFTGRADISQVHDSKEGIIHSNELPSFFAQHDNQARTQRLAAQIKQALHKIPTWDRILTTENETINGVLQDKVLSFRESNGNTRTIPFAQIDTVELSREGLLSEYDNITVHFVDGNQKRYRSANGVVHLEHFGDHQSHKLRNINKIAVGIANKGF